MLQRKKQSRVALPPTDPNLKWFLVVEAAAYLRVSSQMIRQLIHDGDLKAVRFGSNAGFRIDRAVLDAFMVRRSRIIAPYRRGTRPWVAKRWARERQRRAKS